MLRKYIPDPSHVLNYEPLKIKDNLTYEEVPIQVLWKNHIVEEASWEREDEMKSKHPKLFVNKGMYNFEDENFFWGEGSNTP